MDKLLKSMNIKSLHSMSIKHSLGREASIRLRLIRPIILVVSYNHGATPQIEVQAPTHDDDGGGIWAISQTTTMIPD